MSDQQRAGSTGDFCASEGECRELVQRILASEEFRRATRLREFLLYVVDRKLAACPGDVTEVLIGHRVFGRPDTYNPGEDSIVRTEARNLRLRLERYFSRGGSSERVLLEIPRGGYLPVFRLREEAIPVESGRPPRSRWTWLILPTFVLLALTATFLLVKSLGRDETPSIPIKPPVAAVELDSSDPRLVQGFQGAKERAIGYVYTGDGVGDWYDSTGGARYAFCMRDVSHQSTGAAVLGLTGHTHNMLRNFAASVAASRDWCGFWEINKDGFPAPVDYRDDSDFWYCLPANFDVMRACYEQFLWTNDPAYLDTTFSRFYDRTVTDYVEVWDGDRDGIMESRPEGPPRRGIASYHQEQQPPPLVGADLVAAQYKGYLVYAAIQDYKGGEGSLSRKLAEQFREKAHVLHIRFNTEWWNPLKNRYYSSMKPDRSFTEDYIADPNVMALLFGITEGGLKTESALDCMETMRPAFDQKLSYFPEILFQFGRHESAYNYLLELTAPGFRSRGMPEISFAVVGAVATGLMGLAPDAPRGILETLPRLPAHVGWVKLSRVPILRNQVAVRHDGVTETTFTNQSGPLLHWKASFPVAPESGSVHITVDGTPIKASAEERVSRQRVASVVIPVEPGKTRVARLLASGSD